LICNSDNSCHIYSPIPQSGALILFSTVKCQ
jgi:hypothetical protein